MPQSIQITETSPLLHDANCVYCHVDLDLGDHAVVCDRCQSPHHADCWQANSHKCATFGCVDAETAVQARAQASQRAEPAGTSNVGSNTPEPLFDSLSELWGTLLVVLGLILVMGLLIASFLLSVVEQQPSSQVVGVISAVTILALIWPSWKIVRYLSNRRR